MIHKCSAPMPSAPKGYGFRIDACPPQQDPQKKGIVEAGVKYVKGNPAHAHFRDLASAPAGSRLR